MENKKKRTAIALCALAVASMVGATFAYWNQTSTIDNSFDTGTFGSTIVEKFTPQEDWQPGQEVVKEVAVENTGDQDAIVRIKLDESWTYTGETTAYKVNASEGDGEKGAAYTVYQEDATDGLTDADSSVVTKYFSNSTLWYDAGDGWYYYTENVSGGDTTDVWLTSIELLADADIGFYEIKTYVTTDDITTVDDPTWYEYTGQMPTYVGSDGTFYHSAAAAAGDATAQFVLHSKSENSLALDADGNVVGMGYSSSGYVLTITAQTVQPTTEAVEYVFGIELDEVGYDANWVLAD